MARILFLNIKWWHFWGYFFVVVLWGIYWRGHGCVGMWWKLQLSVKIWPWHNNHNLNEWHPLCYIRPHKIGTHRLWSILTQQVVTCYNIQISFVSSWTAIYFYCSMMDLPLGWPPPYLSQYLFELYDTNYQTISANIHCIANGLSPQIFPMYSMVCQVISAF